MRILSYHRFRCQQETAMWSTETLPSLAWHRTLSNYYKIYIGTVTQCIGGYINLHLHFNHLNDITNTITHYIYISSNHHAFGYISTRHEEERSENTISVIYLTKKKGGGGDTRSNVEKEREKKTRFLLQIPFFFLFS